MVASALLPDYEVTDHAAKHPKLSDPQGQHPMFLVLRPHVIWSRASSFARSTAATRSSRARQWRSTVRTSAQSPDWDITTPATKAAWKQDRERKDPFFPYGKTYAATLAERD
jgi:hypothetical protein